MPAFATTNKVVMTNRKRQETRGGGWRRGGVREGAVTGEGGAKTGEAWSWKGLFRALVVDADGSSVGSSVGFWIIFGRILDHFITVTLTVNFRNDNVNVIRVIVVFPAHTCGVA